MNKAHYWAHIYTYDGSKNGLRPETSIVGNLALTSMKHLRLRLGDCGINSSCGSSISDSDDGNTNIHKWKAPHHLELQEKDRAACFVYYVPVLRLLLVVFCVSRGQSVTVLLLRVEMENSMAWINLKVSCIYIYTCA